MVCFGLADLGIARITSAMQSFLLFCHTDVAGINPTQVGTALLVGRLTRDALDDDPLFGDWSDPSWMPAAGCETCD
jgi:Na+/melibiose symporter-like transporter